MYIHIHYYTCTYMYAYMFCNYMYILISYMYMSCICANLLCAIVLKMVCTTCTMHIYSIRTQLISMHTCTSAVMHTVYEVSAEINGLIPNSFN